MKIFFLFASFCVVLSLASEPLRGAANRGLRAAIDRMPAPNQADSTARETSTPEPQLEPSSDAQESQQAIRSLERKSSEQKDARKSVSLLSRIFSARERRTRQEEQSAERTRKADVPVHLNGRRVARTSASTATDALVPAPEELRGPVREMDVRVTVYWQHGSGTDAWTASGKSSTGRPLRCRQTAAVDPSVIPYGSKILLPEAGKFLEAVDTGSAVKSRKAARAMGRNVPVVDVFFESKDEALEWAHNNPHFMRAYVVAPK